MRFKPLITALLVTAALGSASLVQAKELKSIGVTVGDLANPFFVQITKGAELKARELAGDKVNVTLVSSGYDLGQQVAQIDNDHPERRRFQGYRPGGETRQRRRHRGGGG